MITYGTDTALAVDLSSLATSSTFLAGMETNQFDNTTDRFDDLEVYVKGIIGHATTAPVVGQRINIYVWGSTVSLATTAIDVLDGTTSAETLAHAQVLKGLVLVRSAVVEVATAALTYWVPPFKIASLFAGGLPLSVGVLLHITTLAHWGLQITIYLLAVA